MLDPRSHARGLLKKAGEDLLAADLILDNDGPFSAVCFHAQQAAEKSIKAVLALRDVQYPRRHDLSELLTLAVGIFPDLKDFQDALDNMAPFAVEVRYDPEFDPEREQAIEALRTAHEVFARISTFVDAEV